MINLKPRKYQLLIIKAGNGTRGTSTQIKVWPCSYIGCKRILNDVDYQLISKYCMFHRALRIKEKNHRCYVKRVGKLKDFDKSKALLYLLKTHLEVSKFQLLAFANIKNMDSLRSQVTFLRRKGYKIYREKEYYHLEE